MELDTVIVTGAGGLVGSTAVKFFSKIADHVIGIENNSRQIYFGRESSIHNVVKNLRGIQNFRLIGADIRSLSYSKLKSIISGQVSLIIHAAAQPSHDWAAQDPVSDFTVNANGTLHLLEFLRLECPEAVFIHMSTNKVYGDNPNKLPLIETPTRFDHPTPIAEDMPIEADLHSLFGVSKLSADFLAQEYGKYYGLKTTSLRAGCITGSSQQGAKLHGFLNYLVRTFKTKQSYEIIGYKGKQVRDNIHVDDLTTLFYEIYKNPGYGAVFNIGGGEQSNCSVLEAICKCEDLFGYAIPIHISDIPRKGDHKWYVSDLTKIKKAYPNWRLTFNIDSIIKELAEGQE
jgi:CDP-paratose 2-epimerase